MDSPAGRKGKKLLMFITSRTKVCIHFTTNYFSLILQLINDLGDISYQEKIFMNIWNKFIKSYVVIADMKVPAKCQEFIMLHHKQLLQNDLRILLLLHFFNLWDNGLLPSKKIIFLMDFFDRLTMNLKDKGFNSLEVDSDSTDAEEKKTDHQSTK